MVSRLLPSAIDTLYLVLKKRPPRGELGGVPPEASEAGAPDLDLQGHLRGGALRDAPGEGGGCDVVSAV